MLPLVARLQDLLRTLVLLVALGVLLFLAPLPPVHAATINVDDDCSLANAIRSANGESQSGAMNSCETGDSGADTINFTRDVSLTEALPTITSDVTLEGNNRTLRRVASAGDMRLLDATGTGTLTINNLTLRDGRPASTDENGQGGAILINARATTINSSTFVDNAAVTSGGAIDTAFVDLTIIDSTFIGNTATDATSFGGAVSASSGGTVTITNSSFRSNSAYQGGAIDIQTILQATIEGSDFRSNQAEHTGGAIGVTSALTVRNSSFVDNSGGSNGGGGIGAQNTDILLENSSFHGNLSDSTNEFGAALMANNSTVTLRHVTIHNSAGIGDGLHVQNGSTLNMVNSVIVGSGGTDCGVFLSSSISTNINNWIEDGTCSAAFSGDPMLSSPRGSPAYIPPYIGSGLVDAVPADSNCLATDQRGVSRPVGSACDIGAYEGAIPRPPPEEDGPARAPTPARSTCLSLPASIRVTGLSESTQCQRVTGAQIGLAALHDHFIDVVDVWSWVLPGAEVCFRVDSGKILFIDTTVIPRTVSELTAYRVDGMTCATINGAGQAVLMPGPSAPMQALHNRSLRNCMVRTNTMLMFRDGPAGGLISFRDPRGDWIAGWLPAQVTLTALARTDAWFKVDYHGVHGWISADYVTEAGACS